MEQNTNKNFKAGRWKKNFFKHGKRKITVTTLFWTSWAKVTVHARSVTQSCPTLCNPMDCSPPGSSSVHGIFQARYWSGLPFPTPGDLPDPGTEPMSLISLALADGFFTTSATCEATKTLIMDSILHYRIDGNSKISHCHFVLNENNGLVVELNVVF